MATEGKSDQKFEFLLVIIGVLSAVYGGLPARIYFTVNQILFPDIEECAPSASDLSFVNVCNTTTEVCQNTLGSFECHCREGYTRTDNQSICSNINECETETHCQGAYEECLDLQGTYSCDCVTGFFRDEQQCKGTVFVITIS